MPGLTRGGGGGGCNWEASLVVAEGVLTCTYADGGG